MADLVVIVPSRGRPEATDEVAEAFADTCTADTALIFAIDGDDPMCRDYAPTGPDVIQAVVVQQSGTMVSALNTAALAVASTPDAPFAIGFMGDDHRPQTTGWDQAYLDALREMKTGIVYGDDLLQGKNLPTQCAMTSDIVKALGYMAPPALSHLYVDNFWRDLGLAAGCLRYLPEVIIEHRHPVAGKAEWDEGYKRVNSAEMYRSDAQAYADYGREQFEADVAKVRALRG